MTDKIVDFTGSTKGPIDPDKILEAYKGCEDVVVIGINDEKIDVCFSNPCVGMAVYWLEKAKMQLLEDE